MDLVIQRGQKLIVKDIKGKLVVFTWNYTEKLKHGQYIQNYTRYTFTRHGNLKFSSSGACYLDKYIIVNATLKNLTLPFLKDKYPEFFL